MAEHGDSPPTLAAAFGIRPQSVDSWLRTGRIGKERLPALAKRYGCSVAALLGQADDDEDMLSADERKLLADYRNLPTALQSVALQQLSVLRKISPPDDDAPPSASAQPAEASPAPKIPIAP